MFFLAHKNGHFDHFLPPVTPKTVKRGDNDVPQNSLTLTHIVDVKKSHQTCKDAFGIKFLSPVLAPVS